MSLTDPGLLYIDLTAAQLKQLQPLFDYAAQQNAAGAQGIVIAQPRAIDNYPFDPENPSNGAMQVGFLDHDTSKKVSKIVKAHLKSKRVQP